MTNFCPFRFDIEPLATPLIAIGRLDPTLFDQMQRHSLGSTPATRTRGRPSSVLNSALTATTDIR